MFEATRNFSVASTRVGNSLSYPGAAYQGIIDPPILEINEYLSADKVNEVKSTTVDEVERTTIYTKRCLVTGDLPESTEELWKKSLTFAVYTFEGRQYIYDKGLAKKIPLEWIKSIGMLFGNILHNLFIKCIGVLIIMFLSACGVKFKSEVVKKAFRMWHSGTPWKALIGLVVQIALNALSIISLGLFSTKLNRVSGYVEMKVLGDEDSKDTRGKRLFSKDYLAPCQQPFYKILKGMEIDLTSKNEPPMNIIPRISTDQRRDAALYTTARRFKEAVPSRYTNFQKD